MKEVISFNQFYFNEELEARPYELPSGTSEYDDVPEFLRSDVYVALSFHSGERLRRIITRYDDWLLYREYKMKNKESLSDKFVKIMEDDNDI
jgi:hypothetical protein